jgi:hypothetical protein
MTKKLNVTEGLVCLLTVLCLGCSMKPKGAAVKTQYTVQKLTENITIDAQWDKPQWASIQAIEIGHVLGESPAFIPDVQAKMQYDDQHIYVIFRVADHYVKAVAQQTHGNVWEDSCVELFFSPCRQKLLPYFNLEVNCGGTPLMSCNAIPRKESTAIDIKDMARIEIAHTLPRLVDPELTDPTTWTIEYRLPLDLLEKYAPCSRPQPGVTWRANVFKCGDKTSNPHWLTWSEISNHRLDFHQPEFFGHITFD